MSLIPSYRGFNRVFDEMSRDFGSPYWLRSGDNLHVGQNSTEVVNNDQKFGVSLDVSHFKPEELKVHLEGRVLTITGNHELKDEHSFMQRSFTRKWTLPEECDLEAVKTALDQKGHLSVDAPKKGAPVGGSRHIPIEHHK